MATISAARRGKSRQAGAAKADATHNLSGQRLGPKGQGTRERIMQAMMCLLDRGDATPITLSAIAREAGVGMSTLYLYFPDLGELLLAVVARVIDQLAVPFAERLGTPWPDSMLEASCAAFVRAHFDFWQRYARMLQMMNSFADTRDPRFLQRRQAMAAPVIEQLARQMNPPAGADMQDYADCATVLLIGLERISSVVVKPDFDVDAGLANKTQRRAYIDRLVRAQADLLHVMIREMRDRSRKAAA